MLSPPHTCMHAHTHSPWPFSACHLLTKENRHSKENSFPFPKCGVWSPLGLTGLGLWCNSQESALPFLVVIIH